MGKPSRFIEDIPRDILRPLTVVEEDPEWSE